jgi:hypothetical protein
MQHKKYWILIVGDEPGDEICKGPFLTNKEAHQNADDYHLSSMPEAHKDGESRWPYDFVISYSRQISSVFICYCLDKPTYRDFVQPILKRSKEN